MSVILLFKNSTAGMQFLLSFQISPPAQLCHRRTLVTHRRSHTRWAAARVCFPQDVVSQASKASPEMSNYLLEMQKIWERWCPAHLGRGVADTFAPPLQALPLPSPPCSCQTRIIA